MKGRRLTPSQKLVLGELADRHNPDLGCFPSQERLAADSELSRSQVNLILNVLEKQGLIRRYPQWDEKTKRQKATRYMLAFEPGFEALPTLDRSSETQGFLDLPESEPSPKIGHGKRRKAVSEKTPKPCPIKGRSRVRPMRQEPVKEPVREPSAARLEESEPKEAKPEPKEDKLGMYARKINENVYVPPTALKPAEGREMVRLGLVTAEQLSRIGVWV